MMRTIAIIIFCILGLSSCGHYMKQHGNTWSGSTLPGHYFASFKNLNGKQPFLINLKGNGQGYIRYQVERLAGDLQLHIHSGKKMLLSKQIEQSLVKELLLPANASYVLIFKGSDADGNFDIKFGVKK